MGKLAMRQIDWFKLRGYLLGKNKDKYYLVHGIDGRKDFDSILEAQQYVEHMMDKEPTEAQIPNSARLPRDRPLYMFCEKCQIRKDWCWLVRGKRLCLVCAFKAKVK